jgi:hypothetical protein
MGGRVEVGRGAWGVGRGGVGAWGRTQAVEPVSITKQKLIFTPFTFNRAERDNLSPHEVHNPPILQ